MYGNWWETEIAQQILSKKYFHEGEDFADFVNRVGGIFSEELQSPIGQSLVNADFLPAGRSLYGAGAKGKFKSTMSNCYIMDSPKDNIEDIFEVAKKTARIFSMGGGAGINISKLRPRDAKVNNAAKTSTGAVSFLNIFNSIGEVIGANNRRAALMLGLECTHPDIEEFLTVKQNDTAIQSANLSILFTDEFMTCVEQKKDFELRFKVESTGEVISKTINAYEFFRKFCEAQWDFAEPGALYIDHVRNYNLLSGYPKEEYKIDICNPCAEYTGSAYNACNLGSINLYNMVNQPFTTDATFNIVKFKSAVRLGVKALDEILDYGLDNQPLPENKQAVLDYRAIGLGVFALGDMLVAMGIRYGSQRSLELVDSIMEVMLRTALETSCELAKTKGTFGKYQWEYIKESLLIEQYKDSELYWDIQEFGLRNGSLLSVAPTGSIATMTGLSGGVEPLYAISYDRTTHSLEKEKKNFRVFAKSIDHLLKNKGIDFDDLNEEYVVTSHKINPIDRVKLQATMQKYVDNAISSTVNLNNSATVDDVLNTYITAWNLGCKGLTVFRDGCARTSILGKTEEKTVNYHKLDTIVPIKRNTLKQIQGSTIAGHTACAKNLYTTVNHKDGDIFEVFTAVSQGCKSNISTITRLASLALRSGVKVSDVVHELKANVCPACVVLKQQGKKEISNSCGTCIGEAIEVAYKQLKNTDAIQKETQGLLACPQCKEPTLRSEGKCFNCSACGYSKCE